MTYQSFLYCLWWSCLCNLCLHDIRSVQVTRFSLSLLCSQVFLDVFLPRIQINREENKTASSHSVSIPFFPLLGCLSASLLVFLRFSFFFFFATSPCHVEDGQFEFFHFLHFTCTQAKGQRRLGARVRWQEKKEEKRPILSCGKHLVDLNICSLQTLKRRSHFSATKVCE